MKDVNSARPGLELGYVADGRSGGEYSSGAAMLPWLLKERERGRMALPDLDCGAAESDEEVIACLRAAYACGARFATLRNWSKRTNFPRSVSRFAQSLVMPATVFFIPPAEPPN